MKSYILLILTYFSINVLHSSETILEAMATKNLKLLPVSLKLKTPPISQRVDEEIKVDTDSVKIFSQRFDGRATYKNNLLISISFSAINENEKPMKYYDARMLFEKISNALQKQFGKGKALKNIPNYDCATDYEHEAIVWTRGDEVIELEFGSYSPSGSIHLSRIKRSIWFDKLGDLQDFYQKTINEKWILEMKKDSEK